MRNTILAATLFLLVSCGPSYEYSAPGHPRGSEGAKVAWEVAFEEFVKGASRFYENGGPTKDQLEELREAAALMITHDGFHRYEK